MFVAVCRVELHIPADSLKDKRSVVQSITRRVVNQFRVSIAEVESLQSWNLAVLGIAAVANDGGHAREVVNRVVRFIERARMDADVGAVEFDVIPVL